ncbi:hypothetical protein COP2_013748 [Malus domestica]
MFRFGKGSIDSDCLGWGFDIDICFSHWLGNQSVDILVALAFLYEFLEIPPPFLYEFLEIPPPCGALIGYVPRTLVKCTILGLVHL